ncbi:MAG: bifunctional 5,10-methylenetetrahydrofolate dehydrogenase/5,10-methenyltetrahydrofolate cyclohydrolase [Candidatus Uhrbacteria bacterium]
MPHLLDGRAIGARIREKVKARVAAMAVPPGLAVILVGDDPASHLYDALKKKACEEAGIRFELFLYPNDEPEQSLIAKIEELNARHDVTGILVQLPLPTQNADRVIAAIRPDKDVDGFHQENLKALREGRPGIVSALALGIMKLVDEAKRVSPPHREEGSEIVVAPRVAIVGSNLFAEPLRHLFAEQRADVERVDPKDDDLAAKIKTADVLIVAVGKPGLIVGSMVKPGATVIDVGTTRVGKRILGDVDAESVSSVAGALSPVPGGAGPMTVAMLTLNVLKAAELQKNP